MSSLSSSALDALTKGLLKRLGNSHDGLARQKAVRAVGAWMRDRKHIQLDDMLKIWYHTHGAYHGRRRK